MTDFDVLVVGSGAAGLAAALTAATAGASVLVAEAETVVGGSSRLSGGLMMGAGTRFQRAAGIEDDAESLLHDYLLLNQWDVQVAAVQRFAELAGPTVEWVADLGVQFYDEIVFGGDERLPRVHCPVGRGQAVVDVLRGACLKAGVQIALGRRVDRLLVQDGVVVGAAVGDDELRTSAVVIASGGFGANPARVATHYPSAARTEWCWYLGAAGAQGDALDLVGQVNAQMIGHDRGLRLLHPNFFTMYEAYLPGWLVLVDGNGHRFLDETAPYGIADGLLRSHGDRAFAIFDSAAIGAATTAVKARYKQTVPGSTKKQSPNWNADVIEEMVRAGKVHRADTISDLAEVAGLPPRQLQGAIDRYNRGAADGEDVDFGKSGKFVDLVVAAPFYAAEVRPATLCFTSFGPRIDRNAQVVDDYGQAVPGLFAAGECTGGIIGSRYVGSGNSYATCLVFGRLAGSYAAAEAGIGRPGELGRATS